MERFSISEEDGEIIISDSRSDYELIINPSKNGHEKMFFELKAENVRTVNRRGEQVIPITARDYAEYPTLIQNACSDPRLQYVEIGSGLSGFLENMVNLREKNDIAGNIPIGIDPIDYALMREMLDYSLVLGIERERVQTLIKRCDLILNPKKLNLINLPFSVAALNNPQIRGSADIIVSNVSIGHYDLNADRSYVNRLMLELKRTPSSRMFVF